MEMFIRQNKLGFGSEFDIRGPESRYYAHKLFFSPPKRLELMSSDRQRVIVTLRSRLSFFRARYDFEVSNGCTYRFQLEKRWTGVYSCVGPDEFFRSTGTRD
jgi:hypothetical protein